ncbi:MAG: hypothetical protein IJO33_01995 [Bacilli bacterium]|nr:hypothetical protein [Bacilli bacterium]
MSGVTQEIPSLDLLKKLIYDDQYFFEFANSKEKDVYGFSHKILIKHLKDYIRSVVNSNDKISDLFIERARYYNDKYWMDIPYFRNAQDGLDQDFYRLIMDGISGDIEQIAYKIYERLAKELNYDPRMIAYNQNINNEIIEQIHYAKTSSITLDNRIVTCKSWAEIYVAFLKKINIKARTVKEGKHYYVLVDINDVEYKADATNSFLDKDNIYINDLTRIKLNTPACGYFAPIKGNDKNKKSIYEQYLDYLQDWPISKFVTTGNNFVDMILSKIDYLNTIIYCLPQTEAVVYLNQLCSRVNKIFSKEEVSLMQAIVVNVVNNNQYQSTILIVVKNEDDFIYRLLNIPEGLIEVKKEYLENIVANKNNLNIPGISRLKK